MCDTDAPASFADIAVALALAHSDMGHRLTKTKMIAERIGLSRMGYELIVPAIEHDIELVGQALELFKKMSEVEPQVRAVLARKATRRWTDFARAAVV